MKVKYQILIIVSLFIVSLPSYSQIIRLKVTDYGWINSLPPLKPILDDYVKEEETKLNADQPIRNPQRLMKGIANSTSVSSRGLGTDYVNEMENYYIGFSVSAAADLEKDVALENLESGIGGAAGLVVGKVINERFNVYANIGGLSHSTTFQGIAQTDLEADISTFNIGVHGRYLLVPRSGIWGGIKTHFGYEYNYNELSFINELNEDLELDVGGVAVIQGRLKGRPRYTVTTKTHSLPLEVSTDVTFFNFFSVFAGLGGDLNFGTAKGEGDIKAKITSPLTCSSGICTNLNLPELEATGNLDSEEKVDLLTTRAFGGLNISISRFSIYGMVNQTLGTRIIGVAAGARYSF